MPKIKVTAEAVLSILKSILFAEDVNTVIEDRASAWNGKTIQDALNVEYYTFKHAPVSTDEMNEQMLRDGESINVLEGLNRGGCRVVLNEVERLYSKDVDMVSVSASMEYIVQTDKIPLLNYLVEDVNVKLCGLRIPVQFPEEMRHAVVMFDAISIDDVDAAGSSGESIVCSIGVEILLYLDIVSYGDYAINFAWVDSTGRAISSGLPITGFSYTNIMTQKTIPIMSSVRKEGNINLSCANSFILVFEGHNNAFVEHVTDKALRPVVSDKVGEDNNQAYIMTITRRGVPYEHSVIIKDHQITVNADTGNETHTLALVTRGI